MPPEEEPVEANPPADPPKDPEVEFVSKDDLEASISDISEQIQAISSKLEEQPAVPAAPEEKPPWETDPNWRPNNYGELFSAVEKHLEGKGFTKANVDEIAQGVQKDITEKQKKEQEENNKYMEQARQKLDKEVNEIKKEHPDLDKNDVFSFIREWNENHPSSRITSFKDGFEIYSLKNNPTKTEKPKPRLPGAPSSAEEDDKKDKVPRYKSVDDALSAALSKFDNEGF